MASSCTHFCTLCQEDDNSTKAVSRCLECDDWLCTDCEKHHGRSKTSKQHKVITVAEYGTLPPSVLKISNKCTQHNDQFERFCSFHGAPCCIQCVSEAHKECELRPLVDVLQNVQESAAVSHLERDLNIIQKNLEVVEKHITDRLTKVEDEKNHCLNEIKRVRTCINEHLDKMERNILDELSQREKDIKKKIESLASQVESKKRTVVNLHDSLLKTKQHSTDLQLFLSIDEIEKQTSEDAKYVEDLEKENTMVDSLKLVVSPALQSLHRCIINFGKISATSVPSTLKLTKTCQGQAQLSSLDVSTLDKVNLVKTLRINLAHKGKPNPQITACAILPTGECVLADYNYDRLMLYDRKGTYVRNVAETIGYPYDMCYIKDNVVGISFPDKQKVHFIDVSKNKIVKTIQMESDCYGIDCNDGKLFIRLPSMDTVVVMDLYGKIEQRVNIPGEDVTRIACSKNYIYCTDFVDNGIFSYDMDGQMIWKHKYEAFIKPRSITMDMRSEIIFVASRESSSLLAISMDGNQSKVVLSKEDVCSVHVSKNKQLLVCNESIGFAFVYQL